MPGPPFRGVVWAFPGLPGAVSQGPGRALPEGPGRPVFRANTDQEPDHPAGGAADRQGLSGGALFPESKNGDLFFIIWFLIFMDLLILRFWDRRGILIIRPFVS